MWSPSIAYRDTENLPGTMAYLHAPKTPRPNLNTIDAVNVVNTQIQLRRKITETLSIGAFHYVRAPSPGSYTSRLSHIRLSSASSGDTPESSSSGSARSSTSPSS